METNQRIRDGSRERRLTHLLRDGKGQCLVRERRQGWNQLMLRIAQEATERSDVRHLVASLDRVRSATIVRGHLVSNRGSATGKAQDCIPGNDDVSQDPVQAIAGARRLDEALFIGDVVKVAFDGSVAEFVHVRNFVAGHDRALLPKDCTAWPFTGYAGC